MTANERRAYEELLVRRSKLFREASMELAASIQALIDTQDFKTFKARLSALTTTLEAEVGVFPVKASNIPS